MKKKIISVFLACFLFISTCCNSYADSKNSRLVDGGMISLPVLATLSTVAVGCGLVFTQKENLYNLGYRFYNYCKDNSIDIDSLNGMAVFSPGNIVKVSSEFVKAIKNFLTDYKKSSPGDLSQVSNIVNSSSVTFKVPSGDYLQANGGQIKYPLGIYSNKIARSTSGVPSSNTPGEIYLVITYFTSTRAFVGLHAYNGSTPIVAVDYFGDYGTTMTLKHLSSVSYPGVKYLEIFGSSADFVAYDSGSFTNIGIGSTNSLDWGNVQDKVDELDGSISIGVPNNLGSLVGEGVDIFNPTYDLSTDGTVSLPYVDNPSISVDTSITYPVDDTITGEDSIPGEGVGTDEGVWGKVKDFVVSLVVPSDLFWTSAFEGVYAEMNNSFPMINLDNFKLLAVGGKPFPNIYVNILNQKSKIVDGDIINSIVDWLRPLIAGFMMLCLMFFNYRKVYKLIRNTEPFGNIAPGTSDFKTELSAPPMDSGGFSAYDIARDKIRDAMFDIRNEGLSRKNK